MAAPVGQRPLAPAYRFSSIRRAPEGAYPIMPSGAEGAGSIIHG